MNEKGNKGRSKAVNRPKSRYEPGTRMSVLLSNPDYLLEGYAEKRCQYVGVIEDISTSADMADRGLLLSSLDEKRNLGQLPWILSRENDVSIRLSAYNVKISKEDRTGTLLHRIPTHEIASVTYVCDDDEHLLFLKAGDASNPYCPCHVFCCSKQADAEEMCTILQESFQLVYTEATMEHFSESIAMGEKGRNSTLVPAPLSPIRKQQLMQSESEEYVSAEQLVQEYMERLHKLLDFKELGEFAHLLKLYRDNLPVGEFLLKLSDLYGDKRRFLISGMNPFIPEEDKDAFEKYLADNDLEPVTEKRLQPSLTSTPSRGNKEKSGRQGQVPNIDKFLLDIDSQMDNVLEDTTNF